MKMRTLTLLCGGSLLLTAAVDAGPLFKPDLQVKITAPSSAFAGGDIGPDVKISVFNKGMAAASGTASAGNDGYMVDVVLSGDKSVPAGFATYSDNYNEDVLLKGGRISNTQDLKPGAQKSYPTGGGIPADTPPGKYYICAQVDSGQKVSESNENNNVSCRPIEIKVRLGHIPGGHLGGALGKLKPDLQVTVTAPTSAFAGGDIGPDVKISVFNKGMAAASGTASAGNNGYMVDVVLSGDKSVPAGFATYSDNYNEDVLLKGGRISNTQDLTSGAQKSYPTGGGIPADTPPGKYYICAQVDSGQKVSESNENNNVSCRPIEIKVRLGHIAGGHLGGTLGKLKPDLQVMVTAPSQADAGSDIGSNIQIRVSNKGMAVASGTDSAGQDGYMVDVVLSGDKSVPAGFATYSDNFKEDVLLKGGRISNTQDLKPGAQRSYPTGGVIPADTPPGDYFVCARVDPGQKVPESNENNNVSCRPIQIRGLQSVSGKPDLIVSVLNFSPGKPTVNDEITFWVFVKNIGSARADRSTLSFRVGGETNPEKTSVPMLDPGQEFRHERKERLSVAQNYQVTAIADSENSVSESDESNNERIRKFPVTH